MNCHVELRSGWVAGLVVLALGACTSSAPSRSGAAGATGTAGTNGMAGTTGTGGATGVAGAVGDAGTTGTAGMTSAGGTTGAAGAVGDAGTTGTAGATGGAGGAAGATATSDAGTAGATTSDGGAASDGTFTLPPGVVGRTLPTCATPKPSPIPSKKGTSECDYLLQSIDFEDKWSYATPADSIRITNFGTALGYYEINNCSPYCFSKALTIGVDIIGGGDAKALQGEVIVKFPATGPGLPISSMINKRDMLAWIQLEGPTAPPFKIMAQAVVETPSGVLASVQTMQVGYANWLGYQQAEFKAFEIHTVAPNMTFPSAPDSITGVGFRIMAPAGLPKGMDWHGLLIIDHLQVRDGGAAKDPPGTYPFGL